MRRVWFGKISHKLLVFVVLMNCLLLGLVWVLSVQLMEPFYNYMILKDLNRTASAYAQLIEKYGDIEDADAENGINAAFYAEIKSTPYSKLLTGKCIEIANKEYICLLKNHNLSSGTCLLHPTQQGLFGETREPQWNNRNVIAWRAMTMQGGDMYFTLEGDNGMQQMVVCRRAGNGYTVIVSTDLERITQAAQVLEAQMPFIATVLLAVSVLGAWLFSRWFTRPLTEISDAAREIAKGNYNVRVRMPAHADTGDELGVLAQDFNTMAYEVGRTAELQRDLIANISHDLRTPLTLIKGYAETVRDLTGDDPEKRTQQLDVIVDESDRLSALVNSVMELSKYSSGSFKLEPVRFDLAQLCEEVADRYQNICEQNGYTLELQADQPCPVWADPDSMSRVIHNLLGNAIHHIGSDGWVALRVKPLPGGGARVEVEDHGTGIAAEDLPYIFDKYYRARADAGKTGTGLGLSITKAILIAHGYAFGVDSEVGKGSLFWFETTPPPKELSHEKPDAATR